VSDRQGGENVLEKVEVPREAKLVEEGASLREGGGGEEGGQGRGVREVEDEQDEG
jgi:hypothetical protein